MIFLNKSLRNLLLNLCERFGKREANYFHDYQNSNSKVASNKLEKVNLTSVFKTRQLDWQRELFTLFSENIRDFLPWRQFAETSPIPDSSPRVLWSARSGRSTSSTRTTTSSSADPSTRASGRGSRMEANGDLKQRRPTIRNLPENFGSFFIRSRNTSLKKPSGPEKQCETSSSFSCFSNLKSLHFQSPMVLTI